MFTFFLIASILITHHDFNLIAFYYAVHFLFYMILPSFYFTLTHRLFLCAMIYSSSFCLYICQLSCIYFHLQSSHLDCSYLHKCYFEIFKNKKNLNIFLILSFKLAINFLNYLITCILCFELSEIASC
jgi:hypothetical protein